MVRALRFAVGAAAGLCDLFHQLPARDWIVGWSIRDGAWLDGFDFSSDLYRYRPSWVIRQWRARRGAR